ncbi:MAG: ribosomal protein S18-alanine N-acetyltransferase [Vulcanisaeta sp. AZ3]|jgi:ribosomal-protein-alanine N-acetyltransferase|nr:MAG: GCN5 family acetyltransferase [Vulcanisaeta sp. AZ3]
MNNELALNKCDPNNDMQTIIELERAIFKPSEQYTLGFINWLCNNCTEYSYIATINNKPTGYIISCIEGHKRGHVISVGVLTEHRRKGIGEALMIKSICTMASKGIDHVILEVRVSNTPAITLYQKLGFEIKDLLRAYYNDGEDGYLMILNNKKLKELTNKYCTEKIT